MKKGTLYLLPNSLGGSVDGYATELSKSVALRLNHFIVEDFKSAKRLLRHLGVANENSQQEFYSLNEHTKTKDISELINPLLEGHDMGLISDAGVPCVADPGSAVVELAQQNRIRVVPLTGPSSIIMALMASGFNGQQFTFNGYLPREKGDRSRKIKQLEQLANKGHTQIFMDAPYRNNQVLQDLLNTCKMDTLLCIASNITCDNEKINTRQIAEWHLQIPDINKMPVMFILGHVAGRDSSIQF